MSDDCNPLFIFSPAADANACFGECELNESCLGTQYDTMSLACMLFDNQQNECHHLEYTGHESITVHRKSCRSGNIEINRMNRTIVYVNVIENYTETL